MQHICESSQRENGVISSRMAAAPGESKSIEFVFGASWQVVGKELEVMLSVNAKTVTLTCRATGFNVNTCTRVISEKRSTRFLSIALACCASLPFWLAVSGETETLQIFFGKLNCMCSFKPQPKNPAKWQIIVEAGRLLNGKVTRSLLDNGRLTWMNKQKEGKYINFA